METLTLLKELITSSELTPEEQIAWHETLSLVPENSLLPLLKLFKKDLKWVVWTYKNYNNKKTAFDSNNSDFIQAILKEEEALLSE